MNNIKFTINKTDDFAAWYENQRMATKLIVDERLAKIEELGHFGDSKKLNTKEPILELRWNSGLRLYYAYLPKQNIVILLGGTKHGQDKDIKKSCTIFRRYSLEF